MPDPRGRPARPRDAVRGAATPLRARHAARAAVPRGHRDGDLRHGLLLGRRAQLLGGARRVHHRRGLRRRATRRTPPTRRCAAGAPGTTRWCWWCSGPRRSPTTSCSRLFWEGHDPTQGMRQGNDVGTQYRSGIYTSSEAQREAAEASRERYGERAGRGRPRRDHHRDRARAASSSTPRTTTSSTWRRTRAATAASAAPACPARWASPAPDAGRPPFSRRRAGDPSAAAVVRLGGPAVGVGGPPLPLVVLGVGHGLAASATVASPTTIAILLGSATSASTHRCSRLEPPLLLELARQRLRRALAQVHRAAGAERPAAAQVDTHSARRPASQRPSSVRTAQSAVRLAEASPSTRRSAQRDGLKLQPQALAVGSKPGEPRGHPVVRGRAAIAEALTASSACRVTSPGGSKASSSQVTLTSSGCQGPRASTPGRRQDGGPPLTRPGPRAAP